nr:aminotransferase class III-fold pyridoxal phosphate-dependent enzyme [Angustibacter aerolatus]
MWIADEVMCGFGRTGAWFGVDHWGATPDLITFAKGVNSGYVPLGGVIISDAIAETFRERPFPGGLTYSGHPLACGSAVATITAMQDEGVIEHAARIGSEPARTGSARARRTAPGRRRGARPRCLLGARAGARPHHPRAAGAVQRVRSGRTGHRRPGRRLQAARGAARRQHEPAARRPALHDRGRRGAPGPGDPRRRARRDRGRARHRPGALGAGAPQPDVPASTAAGSPASSAWCRFPRGRARDAEPPREPPCLPGAPCCPGSPAVVRRQ